MNAQIHLMDDVFAHVQTTPSLPDKRRREIKAHYEQGSFRNVFPVGSGTTLPTVMVGRKRQMGQLGALAKELLNTSGTDPGGLVGVALHGPRGTGKTALLKAFEHGVDRCGGRVLSLTGRNALKTEARLIDEIADALDPIPEEAEVVRSELGGGFKTVVEATGRTSDEHRTVHPGRRRVFTNVQAALRTLLAEPGEGEGGPVLVTVDEAHSADPQAVGALLDAAQAIQDSVGGLPRACVLLAGTPDLIDVLQAANGTWALDRAQGDRLAPMPNDLSPADCAAALRAAFAAAEVRVVDQCALVSAAEECRGSPYFLQVLGRSALESASRNGGEADFRADGDIMAAYRNGVKARYAQAWNDLDKRGLTGCARQLGALWRWASAQEGRTIHVADIHLAISAGLKHPPTHQSKRLSEDEAKSHFMHLGLLWSPSGIPDGPWELGLPSFFDHVEGNYLNPQWTRYHATLPALIKDEALFIPEVSYDDGTQGSAGGGPPAPAPSWPARKNPKPPSP